MRSYSRLLLSLACNTLIVITFALSLAKAAPPMSLEGISDRETLVYATRQIPISRLHPQVASKVMDVCEKPSFFRRMPVQEIQCDPDMLNFLVRRPEVLVNIWDVMGVTKVQAKRTNPYSFLADDGVGTICKCDLIYGSENVHIYHGSGEYSGNLTLRKITGSCICVLVTRPIDSDGVSSSRIQGTMDVFLKLDNFGADLITRTLGPLVGKTADYNFIETANFISQLAGVCERNPAAAQGLASRLNKIEPDIRHEFARLATSISAQHAIPVEFDSSQDQPPIQSGLPMSATGMQESLEDSPRAVAKDFSYYAEPESRDSHGAGHADSDNAIQLTLSAPITSDADIDTADSVPFSVRPTKQHIFLRR
ncbi:MAG: hypothetical protein KDB03_24540 [Planctomycetales bacterium]|nr:hypothetical protein [Planctomycetales bacterium]